MGQYFKAVVLAPQHDKNEIVASFNPSKFGTGVKQMEHGWLLNPFVKHIESQFTPGQEFYMHRLVWAGDYADCEPGTNNNLYELSKEKEREGKCNWLAKKFRYIVNHTKRVYVDKTKMPDNKGWQIHPLPLLTAEGNEDAGGEYHSCYPDYRLVGTWARDIISVEETIPDGYSCLAPRFIEK